MPRPKKRSFSIKGHRTSLSLEEPFWEALRALAAHKAKPLAVLVAQIDAARGDTGLSTAVRIHLLQHYRNLAQPSPGASSAESNSKPQTETGNSTDTPTKQPKQDP